MKQTWVDDIGVTFAHLISSNRNPNLGLSSGQGQVGPFPVILGPVINFMGFSGDMVLDVNGAENL